MSVPRLGQLVFVSAITSVLLAGCGDGSPPGPRADQVGHVLTAQVYKIFIATAMVDVKVTDPISDRYVPCGKDRVKLTYAVTGKPTTFAAAGSFVKGSEGKAELKPSEIIADLVSHMPQIGTFSVTRSDDVTVRFVSAESHTRMTVHSPGSNKLTISGETDCLTGGDRPLPH